MEVINHQLQARYREIEKNETRWEEIGVEDADYLIVAFGSIARICDKAREIAAEKGIKIGIVRPITLWPSSGGNQQGGRREERRARSGA